MTRALHNTLLLRAATALETVARGNAGHSQAPCLELAELQPEWKDALALRRYVKDQQRLYRINQSRTLRALR